MSLYVFISASVSFKNNLIKIDSLDMIPKIIHYCWLYRSHSFQYPTLYGFMEEIFA